MAPPAPDPGRYDPLQSFAKLTLPQPVNRYRSANGAPGPAYWQNRADYTIKRPSDLPQTKELTATETITYTNNSPDRLDCLWLRLEQNLYKQDSRGRMAVPLPKKYQALMRHAHTNGFEFDSVAGRDGRQDAQGRLPDQRHAHADPPARAAEGACTS